VTAIDRREPGKLADAAVGSSGALGIMPGGVLDQLLQEQAEQQRKGDNVPAEDTVAVPA
jgi:hypothetical protein